MIVSPTLWEMQEAGFPVGGEPSVALDLVDTLLHAHSEPQDLLAENAERWWQLQRTRVPLGENPSLGATRRLRASLRELIEARIDGREPATAAVDDLNRFAASATSAPALRVDRGGLSQVAVWRSRRPGDARLSAVAREGMELVTDPDRSARLRRCANDTCTMIFLADNPRRVWCASNVCGNRVRVARHAAAQRQGR